MMISAYEAVNNCITGIAHAGSFPFLILSRLTPLLTVASLLHSNGQGWWPEHYRDPFPIRVHRPRVGPAAPGPSSACVPGAPLLQYRLRFRGGSKQNDHQLTNSFASSHVFYDTTRRSEKKEKQRDVFNDRSSPLNLFSFFRNSSSRCQ